MLARLFKKEIFFIKRNFKDLKKGFVPNKLG